MLNPDEAKILLDMAAYIVWSVKQNNEFYSVLGNVGHDCIGLLNQELCFLPRTTDYQDALLAEFNTKVGG